MALVDMIKNIKAPSERGILKDLDLWLLTKFSDLDNVDRGHSGNLHPSGISGCPRSVVYERIGVPVVEVWPMSAKTQRIFDNGNSFHKRMQEYYARMGILWGGWKCHSCEGCDPLRYAVDHDGKTVSKGCRKFDSARPECPRGFPSEWGRNQKIKPRFAYDELGFYIESKKISGYTDGLLVRSGSRVVLELKSIKEQNFSALVGPQPDHNEQVQLYIEGFKADYAIVQYESKNSQDIKEYVVDRDEVKIKELLDRADLIWNCLDTRQIPGRRCRSMGESRWCGYKDYCFNDFQDNAPYWERYKA